MEWVIWSIYDLVLWSNGYWCWRQCVASDKLIFALCFFLVVWYIFDSRIVLTSMRMKWFIVACLSRYSSCSATHTHSMFIENVAVECSESSVGEELQGTRSFFVFNPVYFIPEIVSREWRSPGHCDVKPRKYDMNFDWIAIHKIEFVARNVVFNHQNVFTFMLCAKLLLIMAKILLKKIRRNHRR